MAEDNIKVTNENEEMDLDKLSKEEVKDIIENGVKASAVIPVLDDLTSRINDKLNQLAEDHE